MRESFRAALDAYPTTPHPADETKKPPRLNPADRTHLKRWANDERVEEVWCTISSAVEKNGLILPARFFIQEVLLTREIAKSINHKRMQRASYLRRAEQMEDLAKFVQKPVMFGLPLIPWAAKLSQMLEDAANAYRDDVAISRNKERGLKWTRKSKPSHVFMRQLIDDLKELTGRWLDYEVAVLTEIAFEEVEIDPERVKWVRRDTSRSKKLSKRKK